jgi:hypothetical protein
LSKKAKGISLICCDAKMWAVTAKQSEMMISEEMQIRFLIL